jgi:hypothetical protein
VIVVNPGALDGRLPIGGRVGASFRTAPLRLDCAPVAKTTGVARVAHVSDETDLNTTDGGEMSADQAAEVEAAMAEARARLAEVPAEVVVINHVMGLYELAAIHLGSETPDLVAASLAIDSMAAIVEGVGDRLGEDAQTMRDALGNIRMAFVGVKAQTGQSAPSDD